MIRVRLATGVGGPEGLMDAPAYRALLEAV
jgi:hypothetical protein